MVWVLSGKGSFLLPWRGRGGNGKLLFGHSGSLNVPCLQGGRFLYHPVGGIRREDVEGEPEELRSLGGFGQLSDSSIPISIKQLFWVTDTVPAVRGEVWCFCRWPLVVLSVLDGIWYCFLSVPQRNPWPPSPSPKVPTDKQMYCKRDTAAKTLLFCFELSLLELSSY